MHLIFTVCMCFTARRTQELVKSIDLCTLTIVLRSSMSRRLVELFHLPGRRTGRVPVSVERVIADDRRRLFNRWRMDGKIVTRLDLLKLHLISKASIDTAQLSFLYSSTTTTLNANFI